MREQPEALRLADALVRPDDSLRLADGNYLMPQAAAELRRLHAEVERLRADADSRGMFVARLEKMQEQGNQWLTIAAVLALLNDCDMLASRSAAAEIGREPK